MVRLFIFEEIKLQEMKLDKITISESRDAELLTRLNEPLQNHHVEMFPNEFKPWDFDAFLPAMTELLNRESAFACVAMEGDIAVGYALGWTVIREESVFQFSRKTFYIDHVSVQPNYRKSGVAKAMLQFMEDYAKALNHDRLELNHWSVNDLASGAFEKLGFTPFNTKREKLL